MTKQILINSSFFGFLLSLGAFWFGVVLKRRFRVAIFNPLVISIIVVVTILTILQINYDEYIKSASSLSYLLTPATVCLAVPLYEQFSLLRQNYLAIAAGILSGVIAGMASIYLLSLIFGFNHALYASMLPKSVTMAIGMGLAKEAGGIVTLSVAATIATGMVGSMCAGVIFKLLKITSAVAQGLSLGTSSHAMGVARAFEIGDAQAAMASLALAVSGLISVVAVSIFANLI
ncbi:LrgB family protein [Campylobacter sp. 19-13652]|uniref:LrgB family protein n=1 Tax=Campylobacter sp. 19-13652 TaxID=2840180 RepID=UPI001C75B42F|nr:LrgB family protein [Campylobacter sp. 19-13652]BCX79351.1 membrane protein [Campylobacter sp. 19-13652]